MIRDGNLRRSRGLPAEKRRETMSEVFKEGTKKLGFGLMRLPQLDPNDWASVDIETTKKMVDYFIEQGFTYFDTAWMYCGFNSESAAKEALVDRYPRESFTLATKLHAGFFQTAEGMDDIFNQQLKKATDLINESIAIPCTGCAYCVDGCPMKIAIPKYFSLYNAEKQEYEGKGFTPQGEYYKRLTQNFGKASACISCGKCEKVCPQHLPIRENLKLVAAQFE